MKPTQPALRRVASWLAPFVMAGALVACRAHDLAAVRGPLAPEQVYGELFVAVQTARIFEDQKSFVDASPKADPAAVVALYAQQKDEPGFDLRRFVLDHFTPPSEPSIEPPEQQSLREHIEWLWPRLTRSTPSVGASDSLIPLPRPYVVPGGRFREGYYWDTYFTMLGLHSAHRDDAIDDMLQNFAHEIDRFGHIPNGNRTYYLSRSQPPFFSHMVELAVSAGRSDAYGRYLAQLRKEHAYWMDGASTTPPGHATRHVVVLPDGSLLNRYWDELDTPRSESYLEDVHTAAQAPERAPADVYRDLRAAAESGWDFSSRWFGDERTLASIRTTSILPVDLNSLLYHLESTIAKACALQRESDCAADFGTRAKARESSIARYLWNARGYYGDYDWQLGKPRDDPTLAMLFPLFVGLATPERAQATARQVQGVFLARGGLRTTTHTTGQQWDAPNGWAPLHWIAVVGLRRHGQPELARDIATRFLGSVNALYARSHKLVEKYAVEGDVAAGGGGEYPSQDGFGWTNGVTAALMDLYPELPAPSE